MMGVELDRAGNTLVLGSARLPLSTRYAGQLQIPEASPGYYGSSPNHWEALQWVINLVVSGQKPDLRRAIESGGEGGDQEVYVEPLSALHEEAELRDWWTKATGLASEPRPMVLGTAFARAQLLVPQAVLAQVLELLDGEYRSRGAADAPVKDPDALP